MQRILTQWQLRTRTLELGARTRICGIVNITSDSFSDGGSYLDTKAAIARCMQCIEEGADILDLGAESTRPGSHAGAANATVSAEEEQARLLPVIEGILKVHPEAIVSIDTYKSSTARAVLTAGAEIINDVSGFTWDAAMPQVCAEAKAGVILMHTRGRPDEWHTQSKLAPDALLEMVHNGLAASISIAQNAGIPMEAIVIDPGYGFGKRFDENYSLLARQAQLLQLNRPILAGLSRKSFLGHTLAFLRGGTQASPEQRENATLAAHTAAILQGASIIRVHSVNPAVEAVRIADAILAAQA